MAIHQLHYSSFEDLIVAAEEAFKRRPNQYWMHRFYDGASARERWYGRSDFTSHEKLMQLSREPWDEGIRRVEQFRDKLDIYKLPIPTSTRRRMRPDAFDGDEVNIDRLKNGDTEFWIKAKREATRGPQTITILFNLSLTWDRKSDDAFWRAACAIVLADLMETAGYRVEIICGQFSKWLFKNHDSLSLTIVAKQANEPVNIATLTSIMSPWAYRGTIWSAYETLGLDVSGDYGQQTLLHNLPKMPEGLEHLASAILCEGNFDEPTAIRLLKQYIESQNAEQQGVS